MNIHEYQAKELLRSFGVPVQSGVLINNRDSISKIINGFDADLYVVKAQIHAGGRGKAGGVKLAKDKNLAIEYANDILGKTLITHQTSPEGQLVRKIYVESGCSYVHQYYLGMVVDGNSIVIICSSEGGVDIEEVAANNPEKIVSLNIDAVCGIQPFHVRNLIKAMNMSFGLYKDLERVINGMYKAMLQFDASQIEINPLVITDNGSLLALDAKISFDDNALFRHESIAQLRDLDEENPVEYRAGQIGLSYVQMTGKIGCLVNGAGLAMATMDIIKLYGSEPANFLDIGGSADAKRVKDALKIILEDSSVEAVLVNIFGGIMRCDIVAEGIIAAVSEIGIKVPLIVRLSGTNFELGKKILDNSGLKIISASNLSDAAEKAVGAVAQKIN